LARSSVLALTSAYEGTPNVIIEAIALGVPVVSSYCTGGIAELMCVSGRVDMAADSMQEVDAGFITPHYPDVDADGASGAIAEMVASALQIAIGQAGCRQRLSESRDALLVKFQAEMAASKYIELSR